MERWEIDYRGRPRVCYGCYRPGHNRRQCKELVTFNQLSVPGGVKGSYAQVVRRQEERRDELEELEVPEVLASPQLPPLPPLKMCVAQTEAVPAGRREEGGRRSDEDDSDDSEEDQEEELEENPGEYRRRRI